MTRNVGRATGLPAAVSSAVYNANNQLTNWNGTPFIYDADGNMTSNGGQSFTWNARNQLASLNGSSSFQYDAFGRRTQNAAGTNFLYDGVNAVQELTGGTPSANILTGGVDENFLRSDASGNWNFFTDPLGSTLALTDSTGTVQTQYTYDPFGNTTATGLSTSNPAQYTGRENDGTGLYYYRARYYDPTIGRFISEDPIRFKGSGTNFYAYVRNSPINLTDPSGLCPQQNPCAPSGGAPGPSFYAAQAESANWIDNDFNLFEFHRGGLLDAQADGGSTAYANYVFGVYLSAAGYSLSQALAAANAYAAGFSHYGTNVPMDPNYPSTPAVNIANIAAGFNAEQNGTLCSTSQ